MTEEQKEKFCLEYCRHLHDSLDRLKFLENKVEFSEYCDLAAKEKCPNNEVTDG